MGEGPSRLSISVSMGDYQNTRFTLGGETPADFAATVEQVFGAKADVILEKYKEALLNSPYYDLTGSPATDSSTDSEPKKDGWGGGSSNSSSSSSSGKREYPEDPGRPAGAAPECEHGPKLWKNPPAKDWKGWFCSEKKRAGSCSTTWVNDD